MADKLTEKTFQFELVSPEKVLASEEAYMVVVPGEAGDFGVLADHSPLLSSIRPGVVTVTSPDGGVRKIFVAGGFADVNGKICSVLAEEAVNVNELDKAALQEELKNLKDDLGFAKEDHVKVARLTRQIAVTEAKIAAAA
jgi:F-type H+-transporting ATPase subunit epsilon